MNIQMPEKLVRLAIDVPPDFKEKLKVCAAIEHRTVRDIVFEAVELYFQKRVSDVRYPPQ